ncbi:RDD family protein [Chitinophaga costaii]|nr:RDD family protein [Chitinophaga costaii]
MAINQHLTELHLEDIEKRSWAIASPWARAVSFLVDGFLFYVSLFLLNFMCLYLPMFVFGYTPPQAVHRPLAEGLPSIFTLLYGVGCIVAYLLYYTLQETWLSGQTLGKRLTGTEAVMVGGGRINFSRALARSICRLIPGDFIFGLTIRGPLHDRLSNTTVIRL